MSRFWSLGLLALVLLALALPPLPASAAGEVELVVVMQTPFRDQADKVHAADGGKLKRQAGLRPAQVVSVDAAKADAVVANYRRDPRVRSVEVNRKVKASALPNDPGYAQQWPLPHEGVPAAWELTRGAPDVLVAVVDTGVDATHPDLVGRVMASANFSSAKDALDHNGHGTHVAGTIAAIADNNLGIAGIAPNTRLLNAKALDDAGVGTYADVVEALDWAVDHGADVVNLSLDGTDESPLLAQAVKDAQARGVLVVAAAGNLGSSTKTYPAALPGVLSVAATDQKDAPIGSSSFGPWVRVGAPGLDVYSTLPGNKYGKLSGTSMAAAEVSGAVALALAAAPGAAPAAIGQLVEETSTKNGWSGIAYAAGRLDAGALVQAASDRAATLPPAPAVQSAWRLSASGYLVGAGRRYVDGNFNRAADGSVIGGFSYTDATRKLNVRTIKSEAMVVEGNRTVVTGTATIGTAHPHEFRVTFVDAKPAHATIEINGPDLVGYAADADLQPGRVSSLSLAPKPKRPPTGGTGVVHAAAGGVTVTVQNSSGVPYGAGLTVQVYTGNTYQNVQAVTDVNGQVNFATLAAGNYRFKVATTAQTFFSGAANTCTTPACTSDTVVFDTGSVTVTVKNSGGTGYNGLTVKAFNTGTNSTVSAVTNASGQAVLSGLAQGGYRFQVVYAQQTIWSGAANTCTVTACTTDQIVFDTTPVTVTIRNSAGTPYGAGINVLAYSGAANTSLSATTNAGGQATISLPPGNFLFRTTQLGQILYSGATSTTNTCTTPACTTDQIVYDTSSVTLTVKNSGGTPYSGLTVRAYNGATYTNLQLTTDVNGQATFSGLPPGSYLFRATYGGLFYYSGATSTTNTCTTPACTADSVVFDQTPVTVTVRSSGGAPYSGLVVKAYSGATNTGFTATTNASGQVSFSLAPGSYLFQTTYMGQTYYSGATSTTNTCVIAGCTTDQIVFDTSSVTVTVRNSAGTPYSGLPLRLYSGATYQNVQLTTDVNGQATFTGLAAQPYLFRATYLTQFYYSGATSTTNTCTTPACTTDQVVFDTGSVTVTVKNGAGVPYGSGLTVKAFTGATNTGLSATTNASGQATIVGLSPGNYLFQTTYTAQTLYSGATSTTNTCAIPGCTTDQIVFDLSSVTVTVHSSTGTPYSGLTVLARNGGATTGVQATTNGAGQVTLSGLAPGSYLFRATAGAQFYYSGASATTNTCTMPACSTDQVVFDTGAVTVTVKNSAGTPYANQVVNVYSGGTNTGTSGTTDASGQVTFNLSPGNYLFRTTSTAQTMYSGATATTNTCAVPGCTTDQVVYDTSSVTLTVHTSTGSPHAGLTVRAYNAGVYTNLQLVTDVNGQATFAGLPPGPYLFRATYGGAFYYSGATSTTNTCTTPACTTDQVVFDPAPVVVTVRSTAGTPYAGQTVNVYSGATNLGVSGTTDASGNVSFNLAAGSYLFRTTATGQTLYSGATATTNTCTLPGCTTDQIVYDTSSVTVTVKNTSNVPYNATAVRAYNGATYSNIQLTTNASGQVTFTGLAPGSYLFRATSGGAFYYSGATSTTNTCTTPACTTDQVVFDLNPVVVTLKNSSGTPYGAGITVQAWSGATNTGIAANTNASGQATFHLTPGSYLFKTTVTTQPFYSGATSTTNTCTLPGCTTDQIVYDTGSVTVTVKDGSGTVYSGLTVSAYNGATAAGPTGVTNGSGQATIGGLAAGPYLFRVTYGGQTYYSGATPTTNTCTVTACTTDQIVFPVYPVTVTVRNAAGTPRSGLTVTVYNGATAGGVTGTTNGSGQVTFTLGAGSYRFRADYASVQFFSGAGNTCTLPGCSADAVVFETANVAVAVKSAGGTPYGSTAVAVYNGGVAAGISGTTDASGNVTLTVPQGSYRFQATINGNPYYSGAGNTCTIVGCTTDTIVATVVADDFNRANGSLGGAWQGDGSAWAICSNAACDTTANSGNYAKQPTAAGLVDQKVAIVIPSGGFDDQVGLLTRATSDWSTYMLWVGTDKSGNLEVWTLVGGNWSGPIATGTATATFPMTIETITSGTTLTVKVNGSTVAALSSVSVPAAPASATDAGIYIGTAGTVYGKIDYFGVSP